MAIVKVVVMVMAKAKVAAVATDMVTVKAKAAAVVMDMVTAKVAATIRTKFLVHPTWRIPHLSSATLSL